jgi:phosphatidylserine/phosphatidylglycerophosphate/cardiolipin synthase-like enzyme
MSNGLIDLLRRGKPGDIAKIGMYGMSVTTPEYLAIIDAAQRGVTVRVILENDNNSAAIEGLKAARARGLPIQLRVQRAKTLHQKMGVLNDDYFHGTANFSGSSSSKHSEDRFVHKNDAETARELEAELDLLWERSRDV